MAKKVLVLGAHLDDSVIAMGGTIAKLVKAGCQVDVFCLGNGDEGYVVPGGQAAAVKKFMTEAVKAHQILNVASFECYDVPDFGVDRCREFYQQCIRAIRQHRPAVIFGHYWNEYFQHHGMATQSRDAWNQACWDCSADLGKPHRAEKYFHFEVLDLLPEPTHFFDISDCFEAKMAAWAAFEAAHDHLGSLGDQLEARARFHGSRFGVNYAEAFRQSFYLPEAVTDINTIFR
ncbi:MAG: PIG-L family deacetylase [Victivallaceae bacterium]|jgi:LmbE family N-acetylglucosaminyl deacetylase|nr:PIG-L family deacetylase [Victivallaceae bacterium]